ncbi:hypothetical protein NPX13_g7169 [Xylaria arbuscula]|uniref:Helicase ATP-binding domain-containing protein n=1 Tax=Xylaria arbuscula TaxID=114810 RepID=A0A9W8TLF8_9PEZI|nr:hypothetical protein NPX13_g7169 [Xylaria arbuscula]
MGDQRGIFHKTTVNSLQQGTLHTTTIAGSKRSHSEIVSSHRTEPNKQLQFHSASSIGRGAPRLIASEIISHDVNPAALPSEYSQRKVISATPTSTVDRSLSLSFYRYDLPEPLVNNLNSLGIKDIYPWQKQCLLGPGLLDGTRNLVYSAPTGGGKSLVADILMLKRIFENRNAKALLVLPYVALVQEKVRWLRNVVRDLKKKPPETGEPDGKRQVWQKRPDEDNIRLVGFFGGGKIRATWSDFDIGVCTFEKANMLINTAIDDCNIQNLRAVVLDELHMVDDDHRGYLMELIATKLMSLDHNVQIIGMSATLANMELLSTWLDAHMYRTFYRPIPVEEHLVHEGKIYSASSTRSVLKAASQIRHTPSNLIELDSQPIRTICTSQHKELQDPVLNAVVALANETVRSGYGVLVFCSSRQGCETNARIISKVLPGAEEIDPTILERRSDLLAELRSLPMGLDHTLAETVVAGVAFHHAGMTTEERDLISTV